MAAATSCNDSSAPFVLAGSYHSITVDGSFIPVRYDPHSGAMPILWIQYALLATGTPDTLRMITFVEARGKPGDPVDTLAYLNDYAYQLVGDSLIAELPSIGGKIAGNGIRLTVRYALPPSEGYSSIAHVYDFVK